MEQEFGSDYFKRYHHEPCTIPFVANDLWEELDGNESVPVSTPMRFYHPRKNLRKDWPSILKMRYGIEENAFYDTRVSGLILEVTPEMLANEIAENEERYRNNWVFASEYERENFIKSEREQTTAQTYLQGRKYGLQLEMMDQEETTIPGIKKREQRFYEDLTDFEKRVLQWSPEYGFLIDHRKKEGDFFPQGKDQDIKYEIEREYFFHLPSYPELFISLAQEINTNRAIWGLRRSMGLDWPFDSPTNNRRPGGEGIDRIVQALSSSIRKEIIEHHPSYQGDTPLASSVEEVVREMNFFLKNLESALS
jgi:hypothetical protein